MDGGVTSPRRGHIEVRLHQYIIFIKTRQLLPFHLRLFHPPALIHKMYALLFPPENGSWGDWKILPWHLNVKNERIAIYWVTLLWRQVLHLPIFRIPTSTSASPIGGGSTIIRSGTKAPGQKSTALPNYADPPTPSGYGGVTTRNSNSNIITYWTTATYNLPEVLVSSASYPNSQDNRTHFLHAIWRLWATTYKSLPSK